MSNALDFRLRRWRLLCHCFLLIGAWMFSWGSPAAALRAPVSKGTVLILLHGTNSDPTTWNDYVSKVYPDGCPLVRLGVSVSEAKRCYRYQFAERTVSGVSWPNGDGATFKQMRNELRATLQAITKHVRPRNVILLGHSRGGLIARAFLQDLQTAPEFKLGLVTLASPHQGTPFGRVSVYLYNQHNSPDDVIAELRFIFSPSVRYQANDFDAGGNPVRTSISEKIHEQNNRIANLTRTAGSIGYMESAGLHLGERGYEDYDLLDGIGAQALAFLSPGSFDRMLRFVLQNIVPVKSVPLLPDSWSCDGAAVSEHPWACDGDGIVPTISQRIDSIPGYIAGATTVHKIELRNIPHTEETGRVTEIRQLVASVRRDLNR